MYDFEYQWQTLMDNGIFSEEAILSDDSTFSVAVSGVYYTGSYTEESPAAYAPKQSVEKFGFQLSRGCLPESIARPEEVLPGAYLYLQSPRRQNRNTFRILTVDGADGDILTLRLQPVKGI